MIARYTRPEMGRIWSEDNKYRTWLEVELAASEVLAEAGEVPVEAARRLAARGISPQAAPCCRTYNDVVKGTPSIGCWILP